MGEHKTVKPRKCSKCEKIILSCADVLKTHVRQCDGKARIVDLDPEAERILRENKWDLYE